MSRYISMMESNRQQIHAISAIMKRVDCWQVSEIRDTMRAIIFHNAIVMLMPMRGLPRGRFSSPALG
jgi:hypothetical protein